ncbi:hypothetical protein JCM16418A_20540 [Paenibacillus pini]
MKHSKLVLQTIIASTLLSLGAGLLLTNNTCINAAPLTSITSATKINESIPVLKPVWQAKTDGSGIYDTLPKISNGLIYYSSNGKIIAANLTTGKMKWSYNKSADPQIITNNSVFFVNFEGYLVKVNSLTGKLIWKVKVAKAPVEIGAHATLRNGVIYLRNESGGISTYNPVSGKMIWENKGIPMYAGSIVGEYNGVLVVSSTVNNIRTQYFGLDPSTGKTLWRAEGMYSFVSYQQGQLILREQVNVPFIASSAPIKGYLMTLTYLDVTTGKITRKENYNSLDNVLRLGNFYTSIQGSYIYTADGNLDKDEASLNRFQLGQTSEVEPKGYSTFGKWVAGPINGFAFFQKDKEIISVNMSQDTVMKFDGFVSQVQKIQIISQGIYAGIENGEVYLLNSTTGKTLGKVKTGEAQFGNIFISNGYLIILTEHKIVVVKVPKELI